MPYKNNFDRITIHNRWKEPLWNRSGDWIIFGLYKFWFSEEAFEYRIAFFGITIRIWIKRTFYKAVKN